MKNLGLILLNIALFFVVIKLLNISFGHSNDDPILTIIAVLLAAFVGAYNGYSAALDAWKR